MVNFSRNWNQMPLPKGLAEIAYTGNYSDIIDPPVIGDGSITIYQGDTVKGRFNVNQTGNTDIHIEESIASVDWSSITGKPDFKQVSWTGSYNDLTDKPVIPDVQIEVTHSELKTLKDNSQLVPGTWYRITDYTCVIDPDYTDIFGIEIRSAGHPFDIIVRADDESHLNHNAYASHHDGDTYFQRCNLEAWELKYSIDNLCMDETNVLCFWIDSVNGKGAIYWMKDECGNECNYDFKNIQFKRFAITDIQVPELTQSQNDELRNEFVYSLNGGYCYAGSEFSGTVTVDEQTYVWCHTFCNSIGEDVTVPPDPSQYPYNFYYEFFNNHIENYNGNYQSLGYNVIYAGYGISCGGIELINTYSMTIGGGNSFIRLNSCYGSIFGRFCSDICGVFDYCLFVNSGSIRNNLYASGCVFIRCFELTLNECYDCYFCYVKCGRIGLGNGNVISNAIGINVGDNVGNCIVTGTGGTQGINSIRNIEILSGTHGGYQSPLTITFERNKNYTQIAGLNSNGVLKIWNPADLVN